MDVKCNFCGKMLNVGGRGTDGDGCEIWWVSGVMKVKCYGCVCENKFDEVV